MKILSILLASAILSIIGTTVIADEQSTKVLFIGSSTIDKWSALNRLDTDFPESSPLFSQFSPFGTQASGIPGGKIRQMTEQSKARVWDQKPTVVVFYAGENDVAEGASPQEVKLDFQKFVKTRPVDSRAPIVFVSIKPAPDFFFPGSVAKKQRENAVIANHLIHKWIKSEEDNKLYYISIWKPMLGPDEKPIARYFEDDVHMSDEGYDLWAEIMGPYLHRILKKTATAVTP